jgi:hypothetical protein
MSVNRDLDTVASINISPFTITAEIRFFGDFSTSIDVVIQITTTITAGHSLGKTNGIGQLLDLIIREYRTRSARFNQSGTTDL